MTDKFGISYCSLGLCGLLSFVVFHVAGNVWLHEGLLAKNILLFLQGKGCCRY